MDPTPGGLEMGPLQVNAQDARMTFRARRPDRCDRLLLAGAGVADQGRHHAGSAGSAVRREHGRQGCLAGCVIEQEVAAAIDLQVNQARGESACCQYHRGDGVGALRPRQQALNRLLADEHAVVAQKLRPVEYQRGAEGKNSGVLGHGRILCRPSLPEFRRTIARPCMPATAEA